MKHPEGLRVSLVEEGMLDGSGVLKSAQGTSAAYGLSDDAVRLFLAVALEGDGGLAQNKLPRDLRAVLDEALLPLELQNLVEWQRDNRGRKAYIVLTWRGKEALEAAKTKPTSMDSWASRRRASVTPAGSEHAPPITPAQPSAAAVARRASVSSEGPSAEHASASAADSQVVSPSVEPALDEGFISQLYAPASNGARRAATRKRSFGPSSDDQLATLTRVDGELAPSELDSLFG